MKSKTTKTQKITFRTTDALCAKIKEESARNRQSASEYIEDCIRNPSVASSERSRKLAEALIHLQNKINTLDHTVQDKLKEEVHALWQSLS